MANGEVRPPAVRPQGPAQSSAGGFGVWARGHMPFLIVGLLVLVVGGYLFYKHEKNKSTTAATTATTTGTDILTATESGDLDTIASNTTAELQALNQLYGTTVSSTPVPPSTTVPVAPTTPTSPTSPNAPTSTTSPPNPVGIQHHRNEVAVPPAAVTPVTSNQAVNNSNANAASLGTLTSAQVAAANNAAGAASGAQNPIAYNASVGTPNPVSAVQSGSGFTTSVPVMGKAIDPTTGQLVKQWTGQYQNINSIPIQGETPEQNIQTLIANGGW